MARILSAEDEPRLAAFLEKGLRAGGFVTTVVADGIGARTMATDEDFDLLILDLGLPGRDGLDVLRDVRAAQNKLPVIILTARDDTSDRIAGLEAGADDYIGKPFHFEELVARVRARLRGDQGPSEERHQISEGGITLDLRTRWVSAGSTTVELSAREFELLRTFLEHPNQVLSREQLLAHVWGYDYDPGSNVVDVYVGYLRRKLSNDAFETVRGVGYRYRAYGSDL
jgi:DNA-binding response OmpR family regulator